jgi:hypothetical protein
VLDVGHSALEPGHLGPEPIGFGLGPLVPGRRLLGVALKLTARRSGGVSTFSSQGRGHRSGETGEDDENGDKEFSGHSEVEDANNPPGKRQKPRRREIGNSRSARMICQAATTGV